VEEEVKLHIIAGGGIFVRGSGIVVTGVCWFPIAKVNICVRN
jgi:hypothetical protein